MHLVGFIIRIYHDARSAERQISRVLFCSYFCITCGGISYTLTHTHLMTGQISRQREGVQKGA